MILTRFDHLGFQKTGKFDLVYEVAFKIGAEKHKVLISTKVFRVGGRRAFKFSRSSCGGAVVMRLKERFPPHHALAVEKASEIARGAAPSFG